ncbi:Sucrose-phosphatase 2 [Acorus calamus]|uniref:Sucrose-phosphatase n=1 Tax=Acorus calamus TaxID=4465 RepID=A0AAV9CM08_ACOCL|nr:Sucrose-phosphatase 2 [Acorus calamus]
MMRFAPYRPPHLSSFAFSCFFFTPITYKGGPNRLSFSFTPPSIGSIIEGSYSSTIMERLNGSPRLMIVSDLDHTMVDHDDAENLSLLRFNALWEASYRHDSLLVFSTGRSPTLYKELRKEKPMLTPDIAIMSVGTEITYGDSMVPDDGWEDYLNNKWDKKIVLEETAKFSELSFQVTSGSLDCTSNIFSYMSETEQRPHKVSFYIPKEHAQHVAKALSERLEKRGLDVKIIYSGGMDLDILPQGAGKGQALAYLLKKFKSEGKTPTNTLVCGDSGNDAELFSIPEVHGVMVSNAQEELLQWHAIHGKGNPKIIHATERCAAGIIQAIGHFNLGSNASPRDAVDLLSVKDDSSPGHEVVKFYMLYERWRRAEVGNFEQHMQYFKKIFCPNGIVVNPSGVERTFNEYISALGQFYGDKKGKPFRVWVDRVSTQKINTDAWLVKYDKWELTDEGRQCCLTSAVLKETTESPSGFAWLHIHQTWLEGSTVNDPCWIV